MTLICLLTVLVSFSTSIHAAYLPDCQPKAAEKSYDKTLIVFVVDESDALRESEMWYIMKQLACEIPISNNIKTYALDYSENVWNVNLNDGSFYDSKRLIDELYVIYQNTRPDIGGCARLSSAVEKFSESYVVKNHGNVHFIVPRTECNLPIFGKSWSKFTFITNSDNTVYYFTSAGEGRIDKNENTAPSHLVDATKSIIAKILNESDKEETNSDCGYVATIIGYVLAAVFLVALITVIVLLKKERSKWQKLKQDYK